MEKIISKIKTLFSIIITWPVYYISFLFPKNKKIWVFIGWHKSKNGEIFADNSKYLFLYCQNNLPDINAVWLAKDSGMVKKLSDKGYKAYRQNSLKGIYYALRAYYTIIDAYLHRNNFKYSGGTNVIQLMHGKGMKKKGYSKKPNRAYRAIFTSSKFVKQLLNKKFIGQSKIYEYGYSRNDVLFEKIKGSEIDSDGALFKNSSNKSILYAPTFRRNNHEQFDLEKILNLKKLSIALKEKNISLFLMLHPKYAKKRFDFKYSNIYFIEACDLYPHLNKFDLLINDYSSTFVDFLLLDKPIIFYPYDIKEYNKNEGIIFDYDKYTPGTKVYNTEELREAIFDNLENDIYVEKRNKIKKLYHQYTDNKVSQRIAAKLLEDIR